MSLFEIGMLPVFMRKIKGHKADPRENSSQYHGSSMHLEAGKLDFKTHPEK